MSEVDEESDDDDWQHMEKVIEERKSDVQQVYRLPKITNEEILNIDDFFKMKNETTTEDLSSCSFQLQRAIENSLKTIHECGIESCASSSSSSSSTLKIEEERDFLITSPKPSSRLSSSSSRPQSVMKYHSSTDSFDIINSFSDEVIIRFLSLADYTTQRVCRRWSVVQIRVSRLKIVETFTNVSHLKPDTAGQIESELFLLYSERLTNEYRQRARSLIFNLRGNDELRMRVINGNLLPSQLVRMESSETATKHLVQQREAWMAEKIVASRESRVTESKRPISNFGCPVCSHNCCEIFHRRKGIIVDGITTSLKCLKCGSFTDQ